ncbi:MAG: hypothetical protein GF349_03415 [Candidatus Magasanikbacteria bacterium]|nr:hypothetical protein [Candidatus Magasanikbacteria bacterium]
MIKKASASGKNIKVEYNISDYKEGQENTVFKYQSAQKFDVVYSSSKKTLIRNEVLKMVLKWIGLIILFVSLRYLVRR